MLLLLVLLGVFLPFSHQLHCHFDSSLCGWTVDEPWLLTDALLLPRLLHPTPSLIESPILGGSFVGAQGRFGGNRSGNLTSPHVSLGSSGAKLIFMFFKNTAPTRLDVYLRDGESFLLIDALFGSDSRWRERVIRLPCITRNPQIIFRAENVDSAFDIVAVDEVRIVPNEEEEDDDCKKMNDIHGRRPEGVRRAPAAKGAVDYSGDSCEAIKCDFNGDYCSWIPNGPYKVLGGKVVTAGAGLADLTSDAVSLPANAHFQFDLFSSDATHISVWSRTTAGQEHLLWMQAGIAMPGWNRLKLPIRYSVSPTSLQIRTGVPPGGFVAIAKANLVDGAGKDLFCGQKMAIIKPLPQASSVQRLTAVQIINESDTLIEHQQKEWLDSSSASLSSASLPISPSLVRSAPTFPINRPLSISMTPSLSSNEIENKSKAEETGRNVTDADLLKLGKESARISTSESEETTAADLKQLIASIGGQPILEGQLKYIAKKLGFDKMSGERAEEALSSAKRIFGESGVRRFLASAAAAQARPPPFSPPKGIRPILPMNAPSNGGESHPSESVAVFRDLIVPSPGALFNSALAQKVSSYVLLPEHRSQGPFSRQNIDFIVQNAREATDILR